MIAVLLIELFKNIRGKGICRAVQKLLKMGFTCSKFKIESNLQCFGF